MPRSTHIHKSMLLRGVKLPARALDQTDIEMTKGRAARSGRSHGGAPLQGGGGQRDRDGFNYATSNSYSRPPNQGRQSYSNQNGYNNFRYAPQQPPNWQPPPPGVAGFARGPPPPPPSSYGPYSQAQSRQQPPSVPHGSQYQPQPPMQPIGYQGAYPDRNNGRNAPNDGPPGAYGRY